MAKLEIHLLGPFQVLLNGVTVTAFESVKVRALLAYLAAEADRPQSREALAGLLWPDWPQQSAIRNLRNTLVHLRQNISDRDAQPPFLLVSRESIQLNRAADAWVDVIEFETATRNLPFAISLYRGPFLDGFPSTDSAPFEEWVLAKREFFSQQMLKALSRLAEGSLEQGEYEQTEGYARRQIELEPWREAAYQQLMRALCAQGKRVQALAQFESLRKALQRELKVEPSEDTLTLYQQIREGTLQVSKKETAVAKEPATAEQIPSRPEVPKPRHNLPLQLTSFIGREKEIEAVAHLLQTNRLVTLTGPGGTGKTRLALQTAAGLVEQYADGVWLVELAPLSDPALVPTLAARALGLRELPGPQAMDLLQDYLEKLLLLLILDNCEHVIEACIRLADTLLQSCPKLSILTSSREALGIAGEVSFRVPPLTFPEAGTLPPLETLAQSEAVRLFIERATTVTPGFTLTPANAPAILQVCQRLDGIPLAIELAAARIRMLQVEEIAQRLDDRFRLLTGGSRAALPRYQTLRASIDWSYGLLSEQERALLQRLSVFAGGWVLEAAEAVGCGESIQACDVLELLGKLVDKSLVQVSSEAAGLSRYRMLETIRQYAHEKLVEAGQAEVTRHRHLRYYVELAEEMEFRLKGPDQFSILERLDTELDNLRLALAWSLEVKERPGWNPEPGLRLAAALHDYMLSRGHADEGMQWLEQLLAAEAEERGSKPFTPERTRYRARALYVTSGLAYLYNEHAKASRLCAESRELYRSLGADGRIGYAYTWLRSNPLVHLSEEIKGREQALAILREAGDQYGVSEFLDALFDIALFCNEYEKANQYLDETRALQKETGFPNSQTLMISSQSVIAYNQGEFDHSNTLAEEILEIYSSNHQDYFVGFYSLMSTHFEMAAGNYKKAASYASKAMSIGYQHGDVTLTHWGFLYLGRLALLQEKIPEAAEWFEQNLAYCRKKDYKACIADALYFMGLLSWDQGKWEQAAKQYTEALIMFQEMGNKLSEGFTLYYLGKVYLAQGKVTLAQKNFIEALATPFMFLGYPFLFRNADLIMLALEGMAFLAAAQGKEDTARTWGASAYLLGATETWHQRFINTRMSRERQEREECITAVRIAMGEQAYAAAFAEGQAMTQEQAIQLAKEACNF